ncbi:MULTISPECIES: diacylglycerol/lipid kinase family protein [Tenacibaculum]|uniref:diacylglycerol/lipid kinase family protein n=1 Tax=Tenacibaculum TaxID=104267 RepID=UPI001F0A1B80|nr:MULTISPECIES: diacylglycerol kinase family protein [Tenacibaculum]MCH3881343.1 diacylglycerol kinase family lipid kinase [Tenacibaculum aquimarinum]MDO6599063.1 diacylglycerol kinase family lipid kinase [Tenacibaculum sp. 1_MG-2023]
MIHSWFVIANPTSGNKKLSKNWKDIAQLLTEKNIDFSVGYTTHSKHEIELVHTAIQQGYRNIISVGGDGTLHNVVNGIMTQRYVKTSEITVAVIPIGTGNDWIKTYNIPNNIEKAIEIIEKKKIILQDIGFLKLENTTAYFNNIAGIGYDGYVVNKLNKLKRFGSIAYLLSGIAGLFFYKKTNFKIKIANKIIETKCLMTLFGICKFSGGGMKMTDYKNAADGLFDVTIAKNIGLLDLVFNLPKLYNGKIINHKKVETYLTKELKIIPQTANKPFIQADGELIGTGNVTVSIKEKAIQFVIR